MIIPERMSPDVEGDFVLFLIGMRINKFTKPGKWLQVFRAMPRMITEVESRKDLGLLHTRSHVGFRNFMLLQYWESMEKLMAYAHDRDLEHRPAWTQFFQNVGTSGDVGIWHETYHIKPGQFEAIYGNMPKWGLGEAFRLVKAEGKRNTAAGRLDSQSA